MRALPLFLLMVFLSVVEACYAQSQTPALPQNPLKLVTGGAQAPAATSTLFPGGARVRCGGPGSPGQNWRWDGETGGYPLTRINESSSSMCARGPFQPQIFDSNNPLVN
jgi:hypothetical protein